MLKLIFSLVCLLISPSIFAGTWLCSAFAINNKGDFATASHCVKSAAEMVIVYDHALYQAKLTAVDYNNDVAIIHTNLKLTNYYKFNIGNVTHRTIFILGYPLADVRGTDLKIKQGLVYKEDWGNWYLQGGTCQGNSGGPVVDQNDRVIGVLVAGYGSPCSYINIASKAENVVRLAINNGVLVQLGSPTLYTEAQIHKRGLTKTLIFYGRS